jgi:hypothetical protein
MSTPVEVVIEKVTVDADAPYGRKADGTPREKPGPKPGASAGSGPRPKPSQARSKAKSKGSTDYRPGLMGIGQMFALPLSFSEKTLPDAWAIEQTFPGIAEALNDLAAERPEVAAMLDRLLAVGPYGALIAAILPLVIQIATNHGYIPAEVATNLGAQDPKAIIDHLRSQRENRAA